MVQTSSAAWGRRVVGEDALAEVQQFAFGWATPVAAVVMSVSGCLLGILLTTKAPARRGRRRVRLLVYASIALAVIGVWQSQVVVLVGFAIPDSVVRYDPLLIMASLGAALVPVAGGVFLVGYGERRWWWRMPIAAALVGIGIAATHYVSTAALRVDGMVMLEPVHLVVSAAVAAGAASVGIWFISLLKGLRSAFIAATLMGTGICAMHYGGMHRVHVRLDMDPVHEVAGVNPIMLIGIVALGPPSTSCSGTSRSATRPSATCGRSSSSPPSRFRSSRG